MIQILYTKDHDTRGIILAGVTPGLVDHCLISAPAVAKRNLHTLVLWGHGSHLYFCDMPAVRVVEVITNWKRLNPHLEFVEILTCDARHYTDLGRKTKVDPRLTTLTSRLTHPLSKINMSMAKQIKRGLQSGFHSITRSIKVRALPVSLNGSFNSFSILKYESIDNSFAYISAPGQSDKQLQKAIDAIEIDSLTDPENPKLRMGSFIAKVAEAERAYPVREWTATAGPLSELRKLLVNVN